VFCGAGVQQWLRSVGSGVDDDQTSLLFPAPDVRSEQTIGAKPFFLARRFMALVNEARMLLAARPSKCGQQSFGSSTSPLDAGGILSEATGSFLGPSASLDPTSKLN
jgi:hypothetical protein